MFLGKLSNFNQFNDVIQFDLIQIELEIDLLNIFVI